MVEALGFGFGGYSFRGISGLGTLIRLGWCSFLGVFRAFGKASGCWFLCLLRFPSLLPFLHPSFAKPTDSHQARTSVCKVDPFSVTWQSHLRADVRRHARKSPSAAPTAAPALKKSSIFCDQVFSAPREPRCLLRSGWDCVASCIRGRYLRNGLPILNPSARLQICLGRPVDQAAAGLQLSIQPTFQYLLDEGPERRSFSTPTSSGLWQSLQICLGIISSHVTATSGTERESERRMSKQCPTQALNPNPNPPPKILNLNPQP